MEEEALRALPTALDDNALVAFRAILESDRSTLQRAYAQMAAVFDPPYNARRRFLQWKRGEAETPLAFRSTLLALGQKAYPHIDWTALDSLAVERLLSLAQELGVVLTTTEDDELTSLKVARPISPGDRLQVWSAGPRRKRVLGYQRDVGSATDTLYLTSICSASRTRSEPLMPGKDSEVALCAGSEAGSRSSAADKSREGPCPLGHLMVLRAPKKCKILPKAGGRRQ
ncbi:unnamed protein product [Lampetra fluviatilis]